jgi:hypothetical protein
MAGIAGGVVPGLAEELCTDATTLHLPSLACPFRSSGVCYARRASPVMRIAVVLLRPKWAVVVNPDRRGRKRRLTPTI